MNGTSQALVSATHLSKVFRTPGERLFQRATSVTALTDISLSIDRGRSVAIVGESGSGKSTLLHLLLGLSRATEGEVRFDGRVVDPKHDRLLWLRRRTGIVFQDPYSSFNPRRTIGQTVAEPLEALHKAPEADTRLDPAHRDARVREILTRMDRPPDAAGRYPAEFSGGQRQRIAIARALVHGPELLVGDEPVSALDVIVRGRLLVLLAELRRELGLTMITVTHDLTVVPQIADDLIVMRHGRIVEQGSVDRVLGAPSDPYTQRLVASMPSLPPGTWRGEARPDKW